MTFQQPLLLLALLGVVLLAGGYVLAQRRRRQYTLRFTELELLRSVVGKRPGRRRHVPAALFLLGAAGLVVAGAQPALNLEVARNDASVMMVIDTSGSMSATDVSPTRLAAARSAAHTLLNELPGGNRVGLVSFSTSAVLAAPLSENRDNVAQAIDSLQAGGATATGDALTLAISQLKKAVPNHSGGGKAPAMVVLLTDGAWNRGPSPLIAASEASAAGIPIQAIGIGSRDKAVQVYGQDIGGVDEAALQQLAGTTGGRYFFAQAAGQLNQIYSALGSNFAWRPYRLDLTVPLVLLGAVIIVAAAVLSLWWFRVLP
ncbi:MAG: VWA domain-containing protein [Candidatus Dormibacteria bacterium]